MTKGKRVLNALNVSRFICLHVVGKKHTPTHRKLAGICLMTAGVCIAHTTALLSVTFLHYLGDGFGYALHGMGLLPFISDMENEA